MKAIELDFRSVNMSGRTRLSECALPKSKVACPSRRPTLALNNHNFLKLLYGHVQRGRGSRMYVPPEEICDMGCCQPANPVILGH